MKPHYIDPEKLAEKVREVAAEQPDHVYTSGLESETGACFYFDAVTQKPGCIVGHALARMGFTFDDLRNVNNAAVGDLCDGGYSSRPVMWLERVQVVQDRGRPWGEAVEIADRCHPLVDR